MVAAVFCTRPSTICASESRNDAGSIVAFRSFTASQTETRFGFCAIAPGSCCVIACRASEPDTPRLTYGGDPAGRRAATSAGHDPLAGSLAPTPTLSDAPTATVTSGEAAGPRVGDAWAAPGAEHALTRAAQSTLRRASCILHIGTIVLPQGATGMRGFDRAGRRTAASRGTPFLLVNPNGRQTTANTSYALAA